jgi:hypothetical protein
MMTLTMKKSAAALATLAALSFSAASQAASADCSDVDNSLDECFSGLMIQPAKSASFSDLSIGRFNLTALSNLAGYFDTLGLTFFEVSLWSHGAEVASDSMLSDGISFADIGAGRYSVHVSGLVTGPKLGGVRLGAYQGGFAVTAVPEPESYALLGAGLLAVFFMSRRRSNA